MFQAEEYSNLWLYSNNGKTPRPSERVGVVGSNPTITTMKKQERIAKLKQEGFKAIEERNPDKLLEIVREIKRLSKL